MAIRFDGRVAFQRGVDNTAQNALALAVDDAKTENPTLQTGVYIVGHQRLDIGGPERMQVERAVDGQFRGMFVILAHAGNNA